jgi:diaminopropionate ammonia-lyase
MIDAGNIVFPRVRPTLRDLPWWCRKDAGDMPRAFLRAFPDHGPTPLRRLDSLAQSLGIGSVLVKDETARLGLSSFKALGGAYAVLRIAQRRASVALGREVDFRELMLPQSWELNRGLTVCCASDGNHGRSVAAGAKLVGAACKVFLHAGVSAERAAHIEELGAEVVRIKGSYDKSLDAAAKAVVGNGWILVADIAAADDPASAEICGFVMQGYSMIVEETLAQISDAELPTHVFIQAGVGGLAASVAGHWRALRPGTAARFVIVEPERAACLAESAKAGRPVTLPYTEATIMAMLECQTPSPLAWPVVHALADGFMTISEDEARAAVRRLARPQVGDPTIEAGESGAAGLAGLIAALGDPATAEALGLDRSSRALVIATEAPTDRSVWSGAR